MLSAVLPWIMAAAILVLPVVLRFWGEDDADNTVHHQDDPPDTAGDEGLLVTA